MLADLIDGTLSQTDFSTRAPTERELRIECARQRGVESDAAKIAEAAIASERQAALWAEIEAESIRRAAQRESERIRRENSPEFIARRETQELLHKYRVSVHIEGNDGERVLRILRSLEAGSRLEKVDVAWLKVQAHEYRTAFEDVLHAHHRLEADTCIDEFRRVNDPWQAINASGHLRKCNASKEALNLLDEIPAGRLKHPKLKSAMLTTRGGTMRDLQRLSEAERMGEEAHALRPLDFRPCTLLGAVHIQRGQYELGHAWYRKAEERGAKLASVDSELRSLLRGMPADQQQAAIAELCRIDLFRYAGLRVQHRAFRGEL